MIYIAMRFEYRLAFSSAVALIHDPVLILGVFAMFHIEFDLKALAGLLAVIGYSLNDTIVVFDRVRENFIKIRRASSIEIMNTSINQTLSRTIMTSVLTLFVVVSLFVYGGADIHGFALALIIGIVVGTYSSIYVAGALAVVMGLDRKDFLPSQRKEIDDRP
jgi:preprotein translocase subunit SecF